MFNFMVGFITKWMIKIVRTNIIGVSNKENSTLLVSDEYSDSWYSFKRYESC